MNTNIKPAPLPVSSVELIKRRTMVTKQSINDDIDRVHLILWDTSDEYRRFLEAVFDEDTVEGSKFADDLEAAAMIKEFVKNVPELKYIATKNKVTIVKSLWVVLRRYHMGRVERANTVAGEVVSDNNTAK